MADLKRMKEMKDRIYCCVGVGDCKMALKGPYSKPLSEAVCPLLRHGSGFEVAFARGRFSLARAMLQGKIEPSEGLTEVFYQCTLCGGCHEVCNNCENADWKVPARDGIGDHVEIWEAMRADMVDAGVAPMPRHKEILDSINKNHNPYFLEQNIRNSWLPKDAKIVTKNADLLYFVGCTGAYKMNDMPKTFLEILTKANLKIAVASDEWCCGSVAARVGDEKAFKTLAEHNLKLIKDANIKQIVTACSGCYRTFKIDYPKVLGDAWNVKIVHSIELIDELIKQKKLKFTHKLKDNITYHDPCHLGRHARVFDPPRNVITALTDGKLIEMRRNRQYAYCCGAGGGVKSGFPALALEIAEERIKEAEETGAKYLATTCPFCLGNLNDAVKSLKSKIEVIDLNELVKKAL